MKYLLLVLSIFIFPSVAFSETREWYNNPRYLTKIPNTNLGQILRVRPGSGSSLPTVVAIASDNSPSVDIAASVLSVPLYAYSPIAGMAGQYLLGYGLQAAVDLLDRYNDGTLQTNPTLNDLINNEFGDSATPVPGDTFSPYDVTDGTDSTCDSYLDSGKSFQVTGGPNTTTSLSCPAQPKSLYCVVSSITVFTEYGRTPGYPNSCRQTWWTGTWTATSTTWPNSIPNQLDKTLASRLAQRIAQEIAANNQTIKDAIKDLLSDNPNLVPDTPNITNYEVQNTNNQTTNETRQQYIDNLTNQYNDAVTNNNTELAAELNQKIQEQKIEQEKEQSEQQQETFSPLSDNPFEEPYNPGPYDIPARFTSFLNNIKSSGLFSFSSSFFNSLPGGGSPIYTVEAGTYGTHTIDLSETMATGLAVLKTVLLLLFGFLSIRVVILKR